MSEPAVDSLRIEPLGRDHDRAAFTCGIPSLDRYLQRQARQDARRYVAQTFVAVSAIEPAARTIHGYYALSASSTQLESLPASAKRHLPLYPQVPTALLGRLAVAASQQGRGVGEMLLLHAMQRTLGASLQLGIAMLVVDAIDDAAVRFYEAYGFEPAPDSPRQLCMPMDAIARALLKA